MADGLLSARLRSRARCVGALSGPRLGIACALASARPGAHCARLTWRVAQHIGRGASGIGGVGAAAAFQPYYSAALAAGNWSDVTLALSGARQPGAAHAPRSYALYASLGEEATTMVMGSAYFSVLTPGAQLRRHCGPTNLRLRVHIGLRVADGAAMRVGDETRAWASGAALAFDDSFEHEVWNASPEPRLVFIVDVWHPQLTTDEQRLAALDEVGRQRYRRTVLALRNGHGLPEEHDLVAERRVRTVY